MTDEQVKKINNAINKNDIETVLKTLEIIDLTNEGKKVVENSWNNFISSLRGISRMKFVMKCSLTYLRQAVLH